jgi:hypothetical protein
MYVFVIKFYHRTHIWGKISLNSSPPGYPGLWEKQFEQSSNCKSSNLETLFDTQYYDKKIFK